MNDYKFTVGMAALFNGTTVAPGRLYAKGARYGRTLVSYLITTSTVVRASNSVQPERLAAWTDFFLFYKIERGASYYLLSFTPR